MDGMAKNLHAAGTMGDDTTDLQPIPPAGDTAITAPGAASREARNTFWIECYQIAVRVGWIFKTETIIMPAVLDAVVDSGFLRGLLPVLNRGGQSVPPLLAAGALARRPRKKWALVATSLAMAACFAVLAAAWGPLQSSRPDLLAVLFLVVYATFSSVIGVNQIVFAALQGKLISPGHRGRAMVVSVAVGSVLAIAAAIVLLGPWLGEADGFPKIFAATAAFFAVAAIAPAFLDEPADAVRPAAEAAIRSPRARVVAGLDAWRRTIAADPVLVRLAAVAACFSAVLMMFPHYQAFARDRLRELGRRSRLRPPRHTHRARLARRPLRAHAARCDGAVTPAARDGRAVVLGGVCAAGPQSHFAQVVHELRARTRPIDGRASAVREHRRRGARGAVRALAARGPRGRPAWVPGRVRGGGRGDPRGGGGRCEAAGAEALPPRRVSRRSPSEIMLVAGGCGS